jgi:hypothetical protein
VLSLLQRRVARIVAELPEAEGFALAGGAALVIAQVVDRETRDLDFFGATADRVDRLVPALEHALRVDGLDVSLKRANSGFAHFTISDDAGGLTELDLGVDARIREAESGPLGPMLALEELAADKTLALFGRAQARDFVDVAALADRFGFDRLCELAAEKDPGFSPAVLLDMLGSFNRFTAEDFDLDIVDHQRLAAAVQIWRGYLTSL